MQSTEIKFRPNLPEVVTLDQDPEKAKEVPSNFEGAENRFRYSCNGRRNFFYLGASVHKKVLRTRAAVSDRVQICKTVEGESVLWHVEVLAPEGESTPGPRMVAPRTQGATALAAQPAPAPAPPQQQQRGTSHLAQALCLAIDAAIQASEYARGQNYSVTFLGSDIRAMANTVLIQDGGRN